MKTICLDISVLSDYQMTGIGVYTFELIDALLKVNKEDKFILFGISTFQTYEYMRNLELKKYPNVEMKIYRLPARFFRLSFLIWQKLEWPKIETLTGSIDIFHGFNWFMPPQKLGKKVATVFDTTSILFPGFHNEKTTQLDKMRFTRIAKDADLILAISENSKKDFLRMNPKGLVEVVYPAVSDRFNNLEDRKESENILEKYHLAPGYFLSVSTLEPRKNLQNLIEAYLKSGLDIPLVLVGRIGWKNEKLIKTLADHPQIKIVGYVPDNELKILYQQALCLIYPSFYEGFGLPVLEALKCGTPVISSNTSSLPEVGGEAVLYINPKDIKMISSTMKKIYVNKDLRKKLSEKGLRQVQQFSWVKSAEKLNVLYQKIMS